MELVAVLKFLIAGVTGWGVGRTTFNVVANYKWGYTITKWDMRWAVITILSWLAYVFMI